jgi:6-pyruvoyltetrahydropterin/6-carboxytetrahydropterin synthase
MYEVTIIKSFSAAHMLTENDGKNEELHGHNFKVELTVAGNDLDKSGILIDFREVKNWLSEVLYNLDHKYLNELFFFKEINPSSENIAKYIYEEMKLKLKIAEVKVARVKVRETEDAAVTYIPNA